MTLEPAKKNVLAEWKYYMTNDAREEWKDIKQDALHEWKEIMSGCQKLKRRMVQTTVRSNSSRMKTSALDQKKQQIRSYEKEIRQPQFVQALNETICNFLPSAKALVEYYEALPELTDYTMMEELKRIDYTVHTHDNKKITNSSEILAYQEKNVKGNDLLWRCSNQSLLADVIASLTSDKGLIRPQIQAGTFVKDFSLILNFSRDGNSMPNVHAEFFLNVSIPVDNNGGESLSLAGALVTVYFCPDREEFRAKVKYIFPCPELTEEGVHNAAKSLTALCTFSTIPSTISEKTRGKTI